MTSTSAARETMQFRGAAPWRRALRLHGWTIAVWLVLLAMVPYWRSLSEQNLKFDVSAVAIDALPLCFAAMAQAVVVISGGIDLSIGSLMGVINVLSAKNMIDMSFRQALAFSLLLLVLAALASGFTGAIITLTRIPDIVVTLGMLFVWQGVALWIMEIPGGGVPLEFSDLAIGFVGSTSIPSAAAAVFLRSTRRLGAATVDSARPRDLRRRLQPQLRVPERHRRRAHASRRLHARRPVHRRWEGSR